MNITLLQHLTMKPAAAVVSPRPLVCALPLGLLAAALFGLALVALPTRAQSTEPMVYTVGLVTETNGQHWAYLHWRSTAFDLFEPRIWSVWRKNGQPNAPGDYELAAVVRVQTSAAAISALMDRARLTLGEDPDAVRTALTELFEELIPQGGLYDAELASAVIQGVANQPQFLGALQLAARTFPSLAMALGTAHAVPIPASGPVTFEIRHRPTPDAPDEAVLGRVTVDASVPLILPAPGTVQVAPPDPNRPATADLAIPLRWDTPPELRRLTLAQHGFNVWRVAQDFAESNNWQNLPPASEVLRGLAHAGGPVSRLNLAPILPGQTLDATQALTGDHTVVFISDHASRFPGYPDALSVPRNGDQYYYFVTARDLLGRDGEVSPGVLGTFCSRLPPRVPKVLRVENEYVFDGTNQHHLRLLWAANPPEDDKTTTGYAIYRWESTAQMNALGGNPAANLVTIVPHTPGTNVLSYLDDGPGSPAAPADYAKTFWYTLRAIDNSGAATPCAIAPFGGNLSGHSPPVPGVLRDRYGPGAPEGGLIIQCATPAVLAGRGPAGHVMAEPISPTFINVDIITTRLNLDPNLAWVELDWGIGAARVPLGRFEFEPGAVQFTNRLTFIASLEGVQMWVQARAGTLAGTVAQSDQYFFNLPAPGPQTDTVVGVLAAVNYPTGLVDLASGRRPCEAHSPVPPEAEGTPDNGIEISFLPPADMTQYKLYFRVDDGPLTLLREDSGAFPTNAPIVNSWTSLPLYAGEVCFFVQVFDRHGNPSPLKPLGCTGLNFKLPPPTPVLAPIRPVGTETNPAARIQWFSPRWGISSFQLLIRGLPVIPAGTVSNLVYQDTLWIVGKPYRRYVTPDIREGFGSGSLFTLEVPLGDEDAEIEVRVRGNTVAGGQTALSNREKFTWSPPDQYVGPNVPWPTLSLPKATPATNFHPRIVAERNPFAGGGMVRIGEVVGRIIHDTNAMRFIVDATSTADPMEKVYNRLGEGEPRRLTPFVLYRTQVPSAQWPVVPGDVYQVSPRMEAIAWATTPGDYTIYDPFIYIKQPNGASATPTDPGYMYVVDTQPAVSRAHYRYLLVLLHPVTGEIEEILVTNDTAL